MCLFPGMMGANRRQNNFPPMVKKHQKRLYILTLCHFVLALMLMWVDSYKALYEMISAMMLVMTACSANFCTLLFYVMLMLNDVVYYLSMFGLAIQDGFFATLYRTGNGYSVTMYMIWFLFSIVALIVCFYAYREFKGYQFDMIGIGGAAQPFGGAMNRG